MAVAREIAVLGVWYLGLLIPTLFFKFYFVRVQSGGDPALVEPWALAASLFPADALDVWLILVGFAILGRLLSRPLAVALSLVFCVVVGGLSLVALQQTGSFITPLWLGRSWSWVTQHPGLIAGYYTPKRAALTVMAIAGVVLVPWLVSHLGQSRRRAVHGALAAVTALFLGYGVVGASRVWRSSSSETSLQTGFWTAAIRSMVGAEELEAFSPATSLDHVVDGYQRVSFPAGAGAPSLLNDVPESLRIPRHVIIITLETAPRSHYPLTDDSALPVFGAMSRRGIVSDRHHATTPVTQSDWYSLMTGTYPPSVDPVLSPGLIASGSLASLLKDHGYETTFISSDSLEWNGPGPLQTAQTIGFTTVVQPREQEDSEAAAGSLHQSLVYRRRMSSERDSFDRLLAAVLGAAASNRKALVCLSTHLGHYEFVAEDETLTPREKVSQTARQLDALTGELLQGLADRGLDNDVIVLVTGDHGLRVGVEFDALNEPRDASELTYNVPLVLYAPALFSQQVRLPHVTSHIDVTPTMLYLLGIASESFYHGANMLDRRLADRRTFFLSGMFPGLRPVDAFSWREQVFALYHVLDRVSVRRLGQRDERAIDGDQKSPPTSADVKTAIAAAKPLFKATARLPPAR
jgi:hypothetical protein